MSYRISLESLSGFGREIACRSEDGGWDGSVYELLAV